MQQMLRCFPFNLVILPVVTVTVTILVQRTIKNRASNMYSNQSTRATITFSKIKRTDDDDDDGLWRAR